MSLIIDTEHEHTAAAVGERGKLVSEIVSTGAADSFPCEPDFLVLQESALAQPNLFQQLHFTIEHGATLVPAGGNGD